jgi:hypothetical protein
MKLAVSTSGSTLMTLHFFMVLSTFLKFGTLEKFFKDY